MGPRARVAAIVVVLMITFSLNPSEASTSPVSHPQLEGALAQLLSLDADQRPLQAQQMGFSLDDDRVRVVVELSDRTSPSSLTPRIASLGGRHVVTGDRRVSARVPIDALASLARLPGVAFVRRPATAQPLETAQLTRYRSATLPTGARVLHGYGVRGQGVRIAVIDQGFGQLASYLDRGWIAADRVVETIDLGEANPTDEGTHGTQVARIVHDMAPEAELVLIDLGRQSDEVVLERAVEAALAHDVDVVNHSIGWFGSNFGDGTGPVNDVVREVANQGVLWVNAAGNQARQHWIGAAVDRDGDGWLEFGPDRESLYVGTAPSGDGSIFFGGTFGLISLTLVWNDFPNTGQDLDLHLLNGNDETVAVADAPQRGFDPPREELQHLVENPGIFKLKVRAERLSRPVQLQIFSIEDGHTLTPHVPYSSVIAPADCECALAVGAMNLRDWDAGRIEPFSARGPTTDGRTKPDLIAPDGMNGFAGTSAAAPAASGAAALLRSQHPDWSVERVKAALLDNARDLLAPGPDVDSGHGALQLKAGFPQATRTIGTADVHPGDTVTVEIAARLPGMTFGRLDLTERLPTGWTLDAANASPEPTADAHQPSVYRWSWTGLGPGATRTVRYELQVPDDADPGEVRLRGSVNGRPTDGDGSVRVRQRDTSLAQALRSMAWQSTSRAITLRLSKSLPNGSQWEAQLFDLAGRVRATAGRRPLNTLTLTPERTLASGVYLVLTTLHGPDGGVTSSVRKVVVQR